MRFLLDESADARLLPYLRGQGHDVTRLVTDYPAGLADPRVLAIAVAEQRILITDDRDFGELVFRRRQPHAGVIYFRLGEYAELSTKVERLDHVLTYYADQLDQFLVVTEHRVRVRRQEPWAEPSRRFPAEQPWFVSAGSAGSAVNPFPARSTGWRGPLRATAPTAAPRP